MRFCCRFTVVACLLFTAAAAVAHEKWDFHDADAGRFPKGWIAGVTGSKAGTAPRWEVFSDEGHKVLAQLESGGARGDFPVCLKRGSSFKDGSVSARLKPISGRIDQAGGVVFRAKDKDNFYIARANALEDNVSIYVTHNGERKTINYWDNIEVGLGQWHDLKVEANGFRFRVSLNGKLVGEVEDTEKTLPDAGMVGFWTKADSVTYFDQIVVGDDDHAPLVWESRYTAAKPKLDGVLDDLWREAKPLTVVVREAVGGHSPRTVELRALHTDDTLYVVARWPDKTKSDMRDPYVWNKAKAAYERRSKPDDQFALEFPIGGHFDVNMLAVDRDYVADVWHWKAGRGNPVGWVDDKRHIISREAKPNARRYSLGGHGEVFIARLMDDGTASYVLKPPPEQFDGNLIDSFEPQQPSGSLTDVPGKGVHDGKTWTLEMSRKFNTGNDDDAVIDPSRGIPCAIAVLDDELYWRHSVSSLLLLKFSRED